MNDSPVFVSSVNKIPGEICCAQDYETLARQFITAPSHAYIAGGSGPELTLADNRLAYENCRLLPRILRATVNGHTRLNFLNQTWAHPIMLAPVAYQTLVHPHGELETARAAEATDTTLVVSTLSGQTLEDIASAGVPRRWFQLYVQPDRAVTVDLIRRAELAGYQALMLTLDANIKLPSRQAQSLGFSLPPQVQEANLRNYPAPAALTATRGESRIFQGAMRHAPTWDDLVWLREMTRLPLIVKGVLHPEDARQLQAMGVDGLVVSNHGGRTLDGVPATLQVLPRIRAAVGPDFPLLLDSGIRSGSDVFKALALGANAVMVGRLQVFALAVAGALGVAHMLKLLREELEVTMAQCGCPHLADIHPDLIFSDH